MLKCSIVRTRRAFAWAVIVLAVTLPAGASDIELHVTGGAADVNDWVAEATLDLATAGRILEWHGRPDQVAVFELDESAEVGQQVACQVDRTEGEGVYTVAWRVPGTLAARAHREFVIRFEGAEPVSQERVVKVATAKDTLTVTNGDIVLEHAKGIGGMIRRVTVGGGTAALTWADKIYDGQVYYLANHSAERMEAKATGPLRAVVEVEGEYLDAGRAAPSKPRAICRFTSYAGLPFTLVEADVTQDFAHQWRSLHFIEMQIGDARFMHLATDKAEAALAQKGEMHSGSQWAAVYNEKLLVATCACAKPGVYDGGGPHYGAYLRAAVVPMSALQYPFKAAIVYGAGEEALKEKTVQHWSAILADPPTVRMRLLTLEDRLATVEKSLHEKRRNVEALSGRAWAIGHVAVTLAGTHAATAREGLASGCFRTAADAIDACEEAIGSTSDAADLSEASGLFAGTAMDHPFLANDRVAYLWSPPGQGCGLVSIFDRQTKREFLRGDPTRAPFWEIAVKTPTGGAARRSAGTPCEVTFTTNNDESRAVFRWSKDDVAVEVTSRLSSGETLLRSRIKVTTSGAAGLTAVTFPIVADIAPLSPDGAGDTVLHTRDMGKAEPSPVVSGEVSSIHYPDGMQFTALLGHGVGLYFAEEDGQANRKAIVWTPDSAAGTLNFSITHPVLNWGADTPVRDYSCPGDFVGGPFQGDWYDAARMYRKWALTAPWCAKGPIHERDDYPKWLLNAPYWSVDTCGDEQGIEQAVQKREFYDVPVMPTFLMSYGPAKTFEGGNRCGEYFPARLGSAGFRDAIKRMQSRGIRIVPYINGWLWDRDTESYRTMDAPNKAALRGPQAQLSDMTGYGGGQHLVGMCPASHLWRDTLKKTVEQFFTRYGVDGIYFDFLTIHTSDCHNKDHGHAICGGNYWTQAVHGLYEECRALAKELNPEAMLTGEDVAEYCIDVHDTFLTFGKVSTNAPLFPAVYHGYANVFGGQQNKKAPVYLGRWWLLGSQNGWCNIEGAMIGKPPYESFAKSGQYYKRLLKCRWEFGAPYLGYGEMLRPPQIDGDLPTVTASTSYGSLEVKAVEASAWKAPDGTIGVFLLNYDEEKAHEATWRLDLTETGIDASKKVRISRWTPDKGLVPIGDCSGGRLSERLSIEPLGIVALKLEVVE